MRPIKFKQANVTYGEDQPQYLPLPAHKVGNREGEVITCWEMNLLERLSFLFLGKVWVRQLTFYNPLQPINVQFVSPFEEGKHSKFMALNIGIAFWIWSNLSGGKTPFYQSPQLKKFQAPIAPSTDAWWGWKLKAWTVAQDYLVSCGELTYTPTLKEKF